MRKELHPDFFDQFDDIFVSGYLGIKKPDPAIFPLILGQASAESCIFIDDMPKNLNAAANLGIGTIRCYANAEKLPDLARVEVELKALEAQLTQQDATDIPTATY